ncbi:hypothetical protein MX022_03205 [Streptococcus uberis]|uniref:serine O-acetyltransferase n=1 Tax=Streptococcus uberis TaxID=1349 RepID=UPI001FF4919E|nr:hypothetical protein [Streptococcus uberis]MCK1166561.1 hypothetical protein [Streptococcus uberis]MCK1233067.1 hypothetical protein [Streptococcus uberis]MCK1250711.1 hypothetical protein [Streptococcus uberis]
MILNLMKFLRNYIFFPRFRARQLVILSQKEILFFKYFTRYLLYKNYKIEIGMNTKIGKNIIFGHPNSIVIGNGCVIGDNCRIYQEVTIGQNRGKYPTIKNNVIIYPGAKIFGDIIIEDNAVIGANAVINKSVPSNAIVAGIPGKIIGYRKEKNEFS